MITPQTSDLRRSTGRSGARRTFGRAVAIVALALPVAACGSSDSDDAADTAASASPTTDTAAPPTGSAASPVTRLADGPVSLIALGDSLTAGEGDDTGMGYIGRLTASIDAAPGRSGTTSANFGVSGWHSTGMVDGQDGAPPQLAAAVIEVEAAVTAGRAVLATVLIGSNDLWYLYDYGSPEGTTKAEEDAAEATFRANVDRTVTELADAGAVVVLGLPDDQSLRPCSLDIAYLNNYLPNVTVAEIAAMSAMSVRLDRVVTEIAAERGVTTVDTNAPFWADEATMAPDLIHPNGDGYALLADLWFAGIQDLL